MTSPTCTVNSSATTNGVNVTASSTVTIALADTAGVRTWAITCTSTDDLLSAATITSALTIDSVLKTATFTAPAAGSALIFQSVVNGGLDGSGNVDASLTTTFGVFVVLTNTSLRVGAWNETLEGSAASGWMKKFNALARELDLMAGGGALSYGGAPPAISASSSAGVATTPSRSDHTHAHGNQASSSSMHAPVVASGANGFMTGTDKAKLDAATANAVADVIMMRDDSRGTQLAGIGVIASDTWLQSHAQSTTGDGVADAWAGQDAKTGAYTGGKMQWKGGDRGDADHWAGDIEYSLGPEDDNDSRSAYVSWFTTSDFTGTPFLQLSSESGQAKFSGGATGIWLHADAGGSLYLQVSSGTSISVDTNVGIHGASFGGGVKVLFLGNCTTPPSTNPTGGGVLYVQSGALKYRGSSGTVTTIAPA